MKKMKSRFPWKHMPNLPLAWIELGSVSHHWDFEDISFVCILFQFNISCSWHIYGTLSIKEIMPWYESFSKLWCLLPTLSYCSFFWEKCSMENVQVSLLCWIYHTKKKTQKRKKKRRKFCRRDTELWQRDQMFLWSWFHFSSKHSGNSCILNTRPIALAEEMFLLGLHV